MDEIVAHPCDLTLAASIEKEITLQQSHLNFMKWSIYRAPRWQRNINPRAYTPQVISIGPFHHGQEHLMAMERHKLQAFDIYRRRINMRIEAAIAIARNWEKDARDCYAEPINMKQNDFVKMMLVDGCFLLEFMILCYHKFSPPHQSPTLDCSFYGAMRKDLYSDLIMLENQLPLLVLKGLFNQLSACGDSGIRNTIGNSFMEFVHNFLKEGYPHHYKSRRKYVINENSKHLVYLLSDHYNFQLEERENNKNELSFLSSPNLTELWEAGVTIKKAPKEKGWTAISFKDGVLEIPPFKIDDQFEILVRNLLAFEHYHWMQRKRYVTNHVLFLDELISTEKDARLLVKANILTNSIGGCNKEVSKLFNDLCKGTTIPSDYYYHNITEALSKYCKAQQHRWMASLRRDYFNTPWASISVAAATFLILLTIIQTVYSHLSYFK